MKYTFTTSNLYITAQNSTYLIQIPSQFTATEASNFTQYINEIHDTGSTVKKMILDFGQTTFMDSSGLFTLCQIVKAFREKDIELTFLRFSSEVKMILSLVGLDRVIVPESI